MAALMRNYAKKMVQRSLRAAVGKYRIFHILTYTGAGWHEYGVPAGYRFQCNPTSKGYRFDLAVSNPAVESVCRCGFWTADTSNRIRAFIPLEQGDAELVFLETKPTYRYLGLGKALVSAASQEMLDRGFTALYARVWHSNTASMRTFFSASWRYTYTIVEVFPLGTRLRFHPKLPRRWLV